MAEESTIEQRRAVAKARARTRLQTRQTEQPEQRRDLPEIGSMSNLPESESAVPTGLRLGAAFATTPDEESRKDIIQKAIPGTEFSRDQEGNTVITLPDGREAFLNKPGLSMQDVADFASDVVKFLPAARFASGGRTLLHRMGRGGAAAGATSATEDVAATAQGSEQGFQGGKAGLTVAADVAAETVSGPIGRVGRALKRTFGNRTGEIFDVEGNLTSQARGALERAGVDPEQISPDLVRSAIRASEEGAPPEAVTGIAQTERFGVPMTRGQATGDFRQLSAEESLRGRADEPGNIVRAFDRRQNEQVMGATREVQEELGGTQRALESEAEAGARIGGAVRTQAEELDRAVNEAFEEVRGTNASLTREGLDRLSEIPELVRRQDNVLVDPDLTPATVRALGEIEDLAGDSFDSRTIEEIETIRKRLGSLQGASRNATDRRGVTILKRRFDDYLDDAFDNALFSGDERALDLLKEARGLRAEYGRRFQDQTRRTRSGRKITDPGSRAVESIIENNATDEGVVNMLFGRARVFNSENAVKSIRALRRATDNSEEINNTLKQLTFRRISEQAVNNGRFSPRKFVSAFDRIMEQNPGVVREVFGKDEMKTLKEFRDTSERLIQPERTMNPSGTAQALVNAFGRLGQVIGLQKGGIGFGSIFGQTFRSAAGGVERIGARQAAEEAVNPQFLLPGRPSDTTISTAIATARQGGPTAVEEGAEVAGSIGQPEGSTGPAQPEERTGQ